MVVRCEVVTFRLFNVILKWFDVFFSKSMRINSMNEVTGIAVVTRGAVVEKFRTVFIG